MVSHWLLWLLSSYLVLLGAVSYGSVCYSTGGSYSYYCKHGCCDSYSYYTGYQHFCCSGSDQALYIGLGVTAAVIILIVIGVAVFATFSQQQKKKVAVRPSNMQTAAAPVQVGTTVHQSNPSTSVTNKQQPALQPPQQLPPPTQQYPPPTQQYPPPPEQYPPPPEQFPPPMPYPPPYQPMGTSNPVYPPPPPSYPYGVGPAAGPAAGPGAGPY